MGGWDTKITQQTVIRPSTVRAALPVAEQLIADINASLGPQGIPPIRMGYPTGSSAWYQLDDEDRVYGDIDLQIIVPDIAEAEGKTPSQRQGIWNRLQHEQVASGQLGYVHPESEPGHPILRLADGSWVQIDLMPHTTALAKWGRFRTTPERGVKGMLHGNMFSVLGDLMTMSIQHAGVQFKLRDGHKVPYISTRKNYQLVTLTTDIERFVLDIFQHEADLQGIQDPQADPLLLQHTGSILDDVRIANLVNAVHGLALSFQRNSMFRQADLANYSDAQDFMSRFWQVYEGKAMKDLTAAKRDKAETPQAKSRANDDRERIVQGLEYVKGMFP
jgi:hypothetical protein